MENIPSKYKVENFISENDNNPKISQTLLNLYHDGNFFKSKNDSESGSNATNKAGRSEKNCQRIKKDHALAMELWFSGKVAEVEK
ncbi:hypothetical protein [Chryseobacterium lacus]|uniref:hypothetical protein n=1 Tax=Chryseobacterium lacus TaxID=2058346 RepID=UPI000F899350|nr:hypothetical protein [Chryseobacterium lacus]